jgi:hypothetical protein
MVMIPPKSCYAKGRFRSSINREATTGTETEGGL